VAEEESGMKKVFLVAVVFLILVVVPMTLMATETTPAIGTEEMAAESVDMVAAQATFEETCSRCHSLKRPLGKKKDQAKWEKTITRMSSYHVKREWGAIPEDDQKAIVQYLLSVAGK